MLSSLLDALLIGVSVFLALQLDYRVTEVRKVNGGRFVVKDALKPLQTLIEDNKPEMMSPMDDEEFEAHKQEESGRGELIRKVLGKWKSKDKNSQS